MAEGTGEAPATWTPAPTMRKKRRRLGRVLRWLLVFGAGFVAGGYAFRDVQPRSFLAVDRCRQCWAPSELAGLAGAVLMSQAPHLIPDIVIETDKTVAFRLPTSKDRQHYVIVPKKDIEDAGALRAGDEAYLVDAYAVMGHLTRELGLRHYTIHTRGPGEQTVRYLHFHVVEVPPR